MVVTRERIRGRIADEYKDTEKCYDCNQASKKNSAHTHCEWHKGRIQLLDEVLAFVSKRKASKK